MNECDLKQDKKEQQRKKEENGKYEQDKPQVPTDSYFYVGSMFGNLKQKVNVGESINQLMAFAQN